MLYTLYYILVMLVVVHDLILYYLPTWLRSGARRRGWGPQRQTPPPEARFNRFNMFTPGLR